MRLEVKNLDKTFKIYTRGSIEVKGFNNINFKLKKGEFLSLHGPSGAGKSSILKTLYRTYTTTSGNINYYKDDGTVIDIAKVDESEILKLRKEEVGYVSQFLQILPRVSAVDVVSQQLILKGESQEISRQKAKEMLDYLSIREELFDLSPLTFSGGEQQRVNIAKGIIAPKSLLLLDEPTASLDKKNTIRVIEKLKQLKQKGVAMVGIFHDLEAMEMITDKIYELKRV
ncbi:phosphonate C-P lyase system protein PhnL [Malaciobacter mytili]|uniref:Phosphonate C-P lyase system protein PhnL n=1 Tax=Malaciobacter mytili LMG 24559 TaxID=1032238 RepID=A0AAX2ACJ1_9BACT|nr:phosphonate C-P lyase system protein PhnL [Malaciobacter mytili]AXH14975.1 methylphosphonate degradation complex subunit PhnL [Malaciobacter mytili LMG 24559]RXI37567.1 phosphonate C-P lyase system protein PhnL [Malaciobacter mytili]RXK12405.1 phosphonate C-P lyase system protein PhnL [Malaciobacter mytili LMG 24559]